MSRNRRVDRLMKKRNPHAHALEDDEFHHRVRPGRAYARAKNKVTLSDIRKGDDHIDDFDL